MAYSVHLFRLAKLNSEIKYVANSVVSGSPNYAYPAIVDIKDWHKNMLHQLDQWALTIPKHEDSGTFMHLTCQVRYHCLRMVLLRPSPNIPRAENDSLVKCHESARSALRLMDRMYRKNCLTYSWFTFYSLVLSTISMLYCIKTVPEVSRNVRLEVLMMDLGSAMSMLSATGEHWSGAKRSRDILDELGRSTVRWLQNLPQENGNTDGITGAQRQNEFQPDQNVPASTIQGTMGASTDPTMTPFMATNNMMGDGFGFVSPPSGDLFSLEGLPDFLDSNEMSNVDSIVESLFQGFIAPQYPYFT